MGRHAKNKKRRKKNNLKLMILVSIIIVLSFILFGLINEIKLFKLFIYLFSSNSILRNTSLSLITNKSLPVKLEFLKLFIYIYIY